MPLTGNKAHAQKKGFLFSSSDSFEGVSVWLHSSKINRNLIDQLRFGALAMFLKHGKEIINRQISASNYMESIHTKIHPSPHYYLSVLGVKERFRKQGLAKNLLHRGFSLADKDKLPCYLDTHNKKNIKFYEKSGFKVIHKGIIPNSNVNHWAMIRK